MFSKKVLMNFSLLIGMSLLLFVIINSINGSISDEFKIMLLTMAYLMIVIPVSGVE